MSSSRREAAKLQNRQMILTAARGVFAQMGYAQATVRDIIRATPLASGTFYNYFKSKEAIYQALRDDEALALRPHLAQARAAATSAEDFLSHNFRLFFAGALEARARSPSPEGALKVRMDTPEVAAGVAELRDDLKAAMERGLFAQADADLLAAAMTGVAFEISGRLKSEDEIDTATAFATHLILNGIKQAA